MVLSTQDKAVIKNDFEENGWTAYRIVKEHPAKKWHISSVLRLIKKIKSTGSTARRPGSGRPATADTPENVAAVEELVFSQEDNPGSHLPPTKIAKHLNISRESVMRICKKYKFRQYKRVRTNKLQEISRQRRHERSDRLAQRFGMGKRTVKRLVFQDEVMIPLQIRMNRQKNRVYWKGSKREVPD